MAYEQTYASIRGFIAEELLNSAQVELEPETPLLEWGVLNSLNIARLMTYVREQLGVAIPPSEVTGSNFKNLDTIVRLVEALQADAQPATA